MPDQPVSYRYWAVDFDRCLGNVDTLFNHYVNVLRDHHDIDPREITAARQKVEASKGSFDLITYLLNSDILTDGELDSVGREYIKRSVDDSEVLMSGAREFLKYLDVNYNGRYGIVTFGNPYWQRLKIAAAGLADVPCMVVDSAYKAREIAGWYDEGSQQYFVPSPLIGDANGRRLAVREVILVDDKEVAFDGLHYASRGYLVSAQAIRKTDTMSDGRLITVTNLTQIIDHETHG